MFNRIFSSPRQHSIARRWQERLLVTLLVVPLAVVSCAAVPEPKSESLSQAVPSDPPLPPLAYYHFLQGYLNELDEDFTGALEQYRAGLQFDPNSAYLRFRMASLYFTSGNIQQSMNLLEQIDVSVVSDTSVLTQMAKMFAGAGKIDRALDLFDHAIAKDPDRSQSYLEKGIFLLNGKQLADAETFIARSIELAPHVPIGYFYLGKVYQDQGKIEKAKEHFRQTIVRAPYFERGHRELFQLLESDGQVQEAVSVLEGYLAEVNPHHKKFRQELIRLLLSQKAFARALEELDFMIEDDAEDLNAQVRRALVFAEMKDAPRAIEEMTNIVNLHPSKLQVRDYLGLLYEQSDQFDHAIQAYQTNIDRDPTFYDSRIHLGYLLYRLKRFEEAVPHLHHAVELNPGNAEPHLLLGLTYTQSKKHRLALDTFEQGLERHPKNVDLRFNLGAAYDKVGRFPDVVREMEAVLELNPDHADALNYLGYSYADREVHIEKAVALTQRAVALKPDNGYYVDSLGWALFKMGRIQEALNKIKRAAELVKDDPVIFEHMGEIYLKENDRDKARQSWLRSLKLDPTNGKLKDRYQGEGFGDPGVGSEAPAQPQVSQYAE
jgi:tetratricopeptide (TPR) repeat protein